MNEEHIGPRMHANGDMMMKSAQEYACTHLFWRDGGDRRECSNQPTIAAVLNGASFNVNSLGAGGFLTIMGSSLSPCTAIESPMSTQVQCNDSQKTVVKVTANGNPLSLSYVSPSQINVFGPALPGTYSIVVNNSKPVTISVGNIGLGLFQNYHLAASIRQDNTSLWYNNLATPGEVLSIFGTGGGPVTGTQGMLSLKQTPTMSLDGQALTGRGSFVRRPRSWVSGTLAVQRCGS